MQLTNGALVADSKRKLVAIVGGVALLGVGGLVYLAAGSGDPANPAAVQQQRLPSSDDSMLGVGWATPAPGTALDYSKLDPAKYISTPESYGGSLPYGQAMLLQTCELHSKTRHEIDDEENRRVAMLADPTGNYLEKLEFDRKVSDIQCAGFLDKDYAKAEKLMQTAYAQGDPKAKAYVVRQHVGRIGREISTLDESSPEFAAKQKQAKELLGQAIVLADAGDLGSAGAAGFLMTVEQFGVQNLEQAAYYRLLGAQMSDSFFQIDPDMLQKPPFNTLSPEQLAQAEDKARKAYQKCCEAETVDKAGASPFLGR